MFLEKVAALKKQEIQVRKTSSSLEEMKRRIARLPSPRNFEASFTGKNSMALIAEIKRASPSAGVIREEIDLPRLAGQYQAGGASAISVLTETHFFHGEIGNLARVKDRVPLPLLQKDFIIDPFQIYEGRAAGADAVLLIAALISPEQLREWSRLIGDLGMTPLVEVHNEQDLDKVSGLSLPFLGINNRDLQTLQVSLEVTCRLIEKIPPGITVISESGIQNRRDVERLREAGARGILVGEILMRSADPAAKIRELVG